MIFNILLNLLDFLIVLIVCLYFSDTKNYLFVFLVLAFWILKYISIFVSLEIKQRFESEILNKIFNVFIIFVLFCKYFLSIFGSINFILNLTI